MILRLLCSLVVCIVLTPVASAQVYEWHDAQGRLIYGDMPPVGVEARLIQGTSRRAATQPDAEAVSSEADTSSLRFQAEQAAAQAHREAERLQADEDRRFEEERQLACGDARQRLGVLESGRRVAIQDEDGEQRLLDQAQRAEQIMHTMQFINTNCGPAEVR